MGIAYIVAVSLLLASAPPPGGEGGPAIAPAASPPSSPAVSGEPTSEDAEAEGCSADERRERLAKAAARRDLNMLALMATKWAIRHAEQIAATYWHEQATDYLREVQQRGDRYLHAIGRAGQTRRELGTSLCHALAARDASGCESLADDMDRAACGSWLALEAALRPDGAGCDALPPALAGACRHLSVPDHTCASEPAASREACEQLAAAAAGVEAQCTRLEDATRCGWALLSTGLSDGRAVCDRVAPGPGRSTTMHVRTHAVCRAVLASAPARCPEEQPAPRGPADQVHVFAEASVLGAVAGARVVASVQVDTPALCALELEILAGDDLAQTFDEVVAVNSWSALPIFHPLASGADPGALRAVTRAACAPRLAWTLPAAVPRTPVRAPATAPR